jgi:hypothetical protein
MRITDLQRPVEDLTERGGNGCQLGIGEVRGKFPLDPAEFAVRT